eukprot:CAMPEP_0185021256 /NCGR_PEP_ID=MMETSP1103-20130426/3945_1 /TAXON_ID=36769 /ORGANISM="Paraphysomonas bandaiensis, Strain Caron Lab Isolate" /LENGTH=376 /DNA_ID=CAMNT_0027552677 /DNA_START=168 /DNA_END=1298 /DNA_ORIENTATION=-
MAECYYDFARHGWVMPTAGGFAPGVKIYSHIEMALRLPKSSRHNATIDYRYPWSWSMLDCPHYEKYMDRLCNRKSIVNHTYAYYLQRTRSDIKNAFDQGKSVVFSSEDLVVLNHDEIVELKEICEGYDAVKIVITYRNPISRLKSYYTQMNKNAKRPSSYSSWIVHNQKFWSVSLFIEELAQRYGRVFGNNSIVLMDYDGIRGRDQEEITPFACEIMGIRCLAQQPQFLDKKSKLNQQKEYAAAEHDMNMRISLRNIANYVLGIAGCTGYVGRDREDVLISSDILTKNIPWDCTRLNELNEILLFYDAHHLFEKYKNRFIGHEGAQYPFKDDQEWCDINDAEYLRQEGVVQELYRLSSSSVDVDCSHSSFRTDLQT